MSTTEDDSTNEILAASLAAKEHHEAAAATPEPARAKHWPLAAIGVTIGSAALAAALLYANRPKKK